MLRRLIGTALMACGALTLAVGISAPSAEGATTSRPYLQPSPRPAIANTPVPRARAKETTTTAPGHVTGTVIDQRTGAPAPGVPVNVGGVVVLSDQNGNYDRWVPAGVYSVTLALAPQDGTPAQAMQMVDVNPNAATILHLNYTSAAPAAAEQAATAAPTATTTAAEPTKAAPSRLPRTAIPSGTTDWLWIPFGMALLAFGALLALTPRRQRARRAAEDGRLLGSLLTQPAPRRRRTDDDLLSRLLDL